MNIFKNRPRASGKTQELKLFFHENKDKYDTIFVLGHNRSSTGELSYYCKKYHYNVVNTLRGNRHTNESILCLLDEPYLLDLNKQQDIEQELMYSGGTYDIYGIGTLPSPLGFAKYIDKENK